MSHFQTRVKNFFAIRENFFSRRPFGRGQLVGANGFMRLFDPIVKHFSAKNFAPHREKGYILRITIYNKINYFYLHYLSLFSKLYLNCQQLKRGLTDLDSFALRQSAIGKWQDHFHPPSTRGCKDDSSVPSKTIYLPFPSHKKILELRSRQDRLPMRYPGQCTTQGTSILGLSRWK